MKILFDVDTRLYYGKLVFDEYIYAYRFAVATGVRPGELGGLWYGDVQREHGQSAPQHQPVDEETTGKNENAIRSFDMGKEAHEAYEAQVALLKAPDIPLNYTTPLFQIPNQRALFKRWKKYQRDNGVEPQVTLYEMRHTFVSIESRRIDRQPAEDAGRSTAKTWTLPECIGTSLTVRGKILLPLPPRHSRRLKGDSGNTFGNTLFCKRSKIHGLQTQPHPHF